jgi:3-oxoacyl-[acyl-carrier protein] reductase
VSQPRELEGKVALVTGAAREIGRAIAERLGRAGALVCVNYASNAEAAQEVVRTIEAAGGQAFAVGVELGQPGSIDALVHRFTEALVQRTGSPDLDILVNNVGSGGYAGILDTTDDFYDATFARNTRTPFFLVKALYHRLRSGGSVINLSSEGVRLNIPEVIAYNMAKAAVEAFTRTLANELGPRGVRVNAIAPGLIDSAINAPILGDPEQARQVTAATALRRIGKTTDIAEMVHALVTTPGAFVTGQIIEVSGGYRL